MNDVLNDIGGYCWEAAEGLILEPLFNYVVFPVMMPVAWAIVGVIRPDLVWPEIIADYKVMIFRTWLFITMPFLSVWFYITAVRESRKLAELARAPVMFFYLIDRRERGYWLEEPFFIALGWLTTWFMFLVIRWFVMLLYSGLLDVSPGGPVGSVWMCSRSAWCPGHFGAALQGLITAVKALPGQVITVLNGPCPVDSAWFWLAAGLLVVYLTPIFITAVMRLLSGETLAELEEVIFNPPVKWEGGYDD